MSHNERSPQKMSRRRLLKLAAGAAAVGGGVALLGCNDGGENQPTETPQSVEAPEAESAPEGDINERAKALFKRTLIFNQEYSRWRKEGKPEEELQDNARELTKQKVNLVAERNGRKNSNLYLEGDRVLFTGRQFDLKDPTGFVLGTALADYEFQECFAQELEQSADILNPPGFQTLKDVTRLIWLSDNLELEIVDSAPFLKTSNLEELSWSLRALQEAGIKIPKKVQLGEDFQPENLPDDTMFVRMANCGYGYPTGYVKEHVGYFFSVHNPEIVDHYTQMVSEMLKTRNFDIVEPRLLTVDIAPLPKSLEDDFNEMLYGYIADGVKLRKRLRYAQTQGYQPEAEILAAKLDFVRQVLSNRDYSIEGKQQTLLSYQTNDVVKIEDYESPDKKGVFLREKASLKVDPNRPHVDNGDIVIILQGPTPVVDHDHMEAFDMFKVQKGEIIYGNFFVHPSDSGYISREWLGKKIQTSQEQTPITSSTKDSV